MTVRPVSEDFADAKRVATAMRARYEPLRAVALIGRLMLKALFASRSDDVLFWALVHAHYRGVGPGAPTERALDALEAEMRAVLASTD